MQKIDAVVFDLGGVLVDWNPRYLYRKLFAGNDAAMEQFLTEICTHDWNLQQDAGRPVREATNLLVRQYPHHRDSITAYYGRWTEMLNGTIDETVQILRALKDRGVPLFALTNWSAETFPFALERFEFLSWFNDIIVSGVEKLIKPDRAIFELARQRFAVDPAHTLFIDDSALNIAGAADAGFLTHHFERPSDLRQQLEHMGCLDRRDDRDRH